MRGGGPDNVTVVVADVVDHDYGGQTQPILAGAVSGHDEDVAPPNTAAGRASAINPRRTIAKRVVAEPEPPPKPRSRRRVIIAATLVLLLLVAGLVVGNQIIQSNYYVTAFNGTVTIMQGIRARSWATDCRSRTCRAASTTATSCPRSATAKRGNRLAAN